MFLYSFYFFRIRWKNYFFVQGLRRYFRLGYKFAAHFSYIAGAFHRVNIYSGISKWIIYLTDRVPSASFSEGCGARRLNLLEIFGFINFSQAAYSSFPFRSNKVVNLLFAGNCWWCSCMKEREREVFYVNNSSVLNLRFLGCDIRRQNVLSFLFSLDHFSNLASRVFDSFAPLFEI